MNFKDQLLALLKEAHKYQYVDISDTQEKEKQKKPRWYFTRVQWGLIILSALIALLTQGSFDEDFAGYIVSGLSLFAGLFFSFILILLDNFQKIDFEPFKKENNARLMPLGVRLKNYYKKATALSFYIILLSMLCICLLSLSLFDIKIGITSTFLGDSCMGKNLLWGTSLLAFLYKTTTIYFLLDFLWITLYLITSFHDYISSEYDKVKLK